MSKIGRNDPCPCGSGKKHKKCCLNKFIKGIPLAETSNENVEFLTYLAQHESNHVLNLITGMQLIPENYGKNLRLETIGRLVLKNLQNGAAGNFNKLKGIILKEFPHNYLEDPPEELFTENVLFHGGNYTAIPGITSHCADIFKFLTNAIYVSGNSISKKYKDHIYNGVSFILELGQELINRAALKRNMFIQSSNNILIFPEQISSYEFSEEEILKLCSEKMIDSNIINEFITASTNQELDNDDPDSNPLLCRPLVKFNGKIYFLLPSSQLSAINEFILSNAVKYGLRKELMSLYQERIWHEIWGACDNMSWVLIDILISNPETELPIRERIFRFDLDRFAYVCYINNPEPDNAYERIYDQEKINNDFVLSNKINTRINLVLKELKSRPEFSDSKFLTLILIDGTGSTFSLLIDKPEENEERIWFNCFHFLTLALNGEWKHLDLWKFAKVFRKSSKTTQFQFMSTLDLYAIYKSKKQNFYFSDEEKHTYLAIAPGDGGDEVRQAKQAKDLHGALRYVNGKLGYAPVERYRDFAPIYRPIAKHLPYEILTETFNFPLWIVSSQATKESESFIENFADAIAFWLDKLSLALKGTFEKSINRPFTICIEFDLEIFKPINFHELEKISDTCEFKFKYSNNTLTIFMPKEIQKLLVGSNNKGERILMENILTSFNEVPGISFSSEFIIKLIDKEIPLSPAKMILLIDSQKDLRIDNRWLAPPLYLSNAETNILLDDLISIINPDKTIQDKIIGKDEKNNFCNQVAEALLNNLINKINEFDNEDLLKRLIDLSETLIFKREFNKIITPAQIHCFGDLPSKVNQLLSREENIAATSLFMRCLIEYTAAQPARGSKKASYDDIDEMLAIMGEIVNFGIISDSIHLGLDDPDIGMLPSGRIGISKSFYNDKLKPFQKASAEASIELYLENFSDAFEIYRHETNTEEVEKFLDTADEAFLKDWGIDFTNLNTICSAAMRFAAEKEDSVCEMWEKDFLGALKATTIIPESQIKVGLDKLSLCKRDKYLIAPDGYPNNEVFPWKYNREFSYIRRPFIVIDINGQKKYIWGMRGALDASMQLHTHFHSGRLNYGGKEIKKLLGKIRDERGSKYRDFVKNWLKENTTLKVWDYEVAIKPQGHMEADKNYGDIDILAFDDEKKIVFSIECKRTTKAKIVHEMKKELDNYLGRNGNNGMVHKHLERDQWMKTNIGTVKKFVGVSENITIKSIILTSEVIPIYYLKAESLVLPFISFSELKRNKTLL